MDIYVCNKLFIIVITIIIIIFLYYILWLGLLRRSVQKHFSVKSDLFKMRQMRVNLWLFNCYASIHFTCFHAINTCMA